MPIVNCFTTHREISNQTLIDLVQKWSEIIKVDKKDITLNFVTSHVQASQKYELLVFLYLPALWSKKSIIKIQLTLFDLLIYTFKVPANKVFILTSIVESGNIIENGKAVTWKENNL